MFLPGLAIALKIASIIIASWIIIHLLAVFGIFLALAYPFWWFVAPKSTVCLNCQARTVGDFCSFCKSTIDVDNHPKNFSSVIKNALLILVFSLVSISIVYFESQIISKVSIFPASRTVSFSVDDSSKYRIHEIFPMEINVSGIETPINAVQVDLSFDPDQLEVIELSTENSFATVFIDQEINNEVGFARLTGGLPNPGYSLNRGLFGTVYFRAKSPGTATVEFLPTSVVLANDSKGTNVLSSLPKNSFYILDEKINYDDQKIQLDQVRLESNVLGIESDRTQIHLYLENKELLPNNAKPVVLGDNDIRDALDGSNDINKNIVIRSIVILDNYILSIYKSILN